MRPNLSALYAMAAIAGVTPAQSSLRDVYRSPKRKPRTDLEREIAAHNEEVDRRKAEKKAKKVKV